MRSFLVVRAAVLALVAGASVFALVRTGEAETADLLAGAIAGRFEGDGGGWVATSAATIVLVGDGPAHGGARALRIESTSAGTAGARTPYWLVPTVAGVAHTLRVWIYDDDPNTSSVEVELAFIRSDGRTRNAFTASAGSGTAGWQEVALTRSGDEGTAYVSIEVRATVVGAGARFYLDDVTLERDPLPPVTPTPSPSGTAVVTPTPSATSSATATSTRTATPAPTSSATGTATAPAAPRVFDTLTNGDFSAGLYGWSDIGADVEAAGGAVRLVSGSTSTKYLYQVVRVSPGGWYEASAYLELGAGVDAGWVRVAWYASGDGGGSQLATADSTVLNGGGAAGVVATGAVQAPFEAHTAQIRVMLRPLGGGFAELTVDDVRFEATSAPPPPAPPAAPAATSAAGPSAGGTGGGMGAPAPAAGTSGDQGGPAPGAGGGAATENAGGSSPGGTRASGASTGGAAGSGGGPGRATAGSTTGATASARAGGAGATSVAAPRLEGAASEILLRITELMPDPSEPGNDADFEWVEVSNVGTAPIGLGGMVLRDNTGVVALPDLVLAAGASLVMAGPRAAVPQASAFWPPGGLSNGLGNSGDRLALLAADGRLIDALSYGSDGTYDNPPLPAPGAGRSLKRFFGDDGAFAGYEVSSEPSPGRLDAPPVRLGSGDGTSEGEATTAVEGGGSDRSTWYVLGALGVVALAGAAGQRVWALRRGGGGAAADGA